MFNISLKFSKPKTTLPMSISVSISSKKKSKVLNFIPSFLKSKAGLSIIDRDQVAIESPKEPMFISNFPIVPSSLDNSKLKKKEFVRIFYHLFKKFINQIPIGLGIVGGMYAIHRILFMDSSNFNEDLESLECSLIIY